MRGEADAIGTIGDTREGFVDLADQGLLVFDQPERELAFPIVGTKIGHVDGHRRLIAVPLTLAVERVAREVLHVPRQLCAFSQQRVFELVELALLQVRFGNALGLLDRRGRSDFLCGG